MNPQSSQNQNQNAFNQGTSVSNGSTANNFNTANTSSTGYNQNPWAVQSPFLTQGFNAAGGALGASNAFNPTAINAFSGMLGTGSSLLAPGSSAVNKGLFDLANFTPPSASDIAGNTALFSSNPALAGMVKSATDPIFNQLNWQTLPGIDRNAALSNNQNSSRTGAQEAIAQTGAGQVAGGIASNIYGNAWNSGQNAALNLAQLVQSGQLTAANSLLSGGQGALSQGAGLTGQGVSGLYNSPFAGLNNYWNIVGGNNWGGTGTTTGATTGVGATSGLTSNGAFNQGFGTGNGTTTNNPSTLATFGADLGVLGSLFSDRRAKTDIESIGKDPETGVKLYAYRYKNDPKTYPKVVGPMAQELARVRPVKQTTKGLLYAA